MRRDFLDYHPSSKYRDNEEVWIAVVYNRGKNVSEEKECLKLLKRMVKGETVYNDVGSKVDYIFGHAKFGGLHVRGSDGTNNSILVYDFTTVKKSSSSLSEV